MPATAVQTRVLSFDEPGLRERWNALVSGGATPTGFLTWEFQKTWWETLGGEGETLLVAAERDGEVVAIAPFFAIEGMVWFVGSSFEFEYLDLIGDGSDPAVVSALLERARDHSSSFAQLTVEFLPVDSPTRDLMEQVAPELGLSFTKLYRMDLAEIDVADREATLARANRASVLKLERWFTRNGRLQVTHLRDGAEILPQLGALYEQHCARWPNDENKSRFFNPEVRAFFERITERAATSGWLRFTRIDWDGRPLAFHWGHAYDGRYFVGPTCFAPELARRSPGRLLLRHLMLDALDDGAHTLYLGTGDQPFKLELASRVNKVGTYRIQPEEGG
jgi:CelD/BcsL family acetyltransferase involved in cellulose biosynthesis